MKYLEEYKLLILKKLLLEVAGKISKYTVMDFWYRREPTNWKDILDYILHLSEKDFATIKSISMKENFFIKELNNLPIEADFDEHGYPAYAVFDYRELERSNYFGLGEKLFQRYKEECCELDIHKPIVPLLISLEELKNLKLWNSGIPYATTIFKNLEIELFLTAEQTKFSTKYLDDYIDEFINDKIETGSSDKLFFNYHKSVDDTASYIKGYMRVYPSTNIMVSPEEIVRHNVEEGKVASYIQQYRFLETMLACEKNGWIKLKSLDSNGRVLFDRLKENKTEKIWPGRVLQSRPIFKVISGESTNTIGVDHEKPQSDHGPIPSVKIDGDHLVFGRKKIPVERGQKQMTKLFLESAKILRNGKLSRGSIPLDLHEFKQAGGYRNEGAFRNALNKFRRKLVRFGLPVRIDNPGTRKYQMIINYTSGRK